MKVCIEASVGHFLTVAIALKYKYFPSVGLGAIVEAEAGIDRFLNSDVFRILSCATIVWIEA